MMNPEFEQTKEAVARSTPVSGQVDLLHASVDLLAEKVRHLAARMEDGLAPPRPETGDVRAVNPVSGDSRLTTRLHQAVEQVDTIAAVVDDLVARLEV